MTNIKFDNKHFIQFMNQIGLTTMELAKVLDMHYETAKLRIETLRFTAYDICMLSNYTTIPVLDIINIILGKSTLKEITIPYALTKEIALTKLRQDDDFLRMIIECSFVGGAQKHRVATQTEINALKSHILKLTKC